MVRTLTSRQIFKGRSSFFVLEIKLKLDFGFFTRLPHRDCNQVVRPRRDFKIIPERKAIVHREGLHSFGATYRSPTSVKVAVT